MLEDIIVERRNKLERYRKTANPYPAKVVRGVSLQEVKKNFAALSKKKKPVTVVGRIRAWRDQGKIIFSDIEDGTGNVQLVIDRERVKNMELIKATFDSGDFVEAKGAPYVTKRGEKSILVSTIRLIAKSLRPVPQSWYGLEDVETRLRRRYLDLLVHPAARDLFVKKNMFWKTVRNILEEERFLEVETPVLEAIPGGAEAEPFVTHHKALDTDFYLRISLELPLKKLLVGGYEKIFEIGRIFRNEGIDREHLQDYTQMECYWAYADYGDMMRLVEKMYKAVIKKTFGRLETTYMGDTIDWGKKWPKVDYYAVFKKETGIDLEKIVSVEDLYLEAKKLGLKPEAGLGRGKLIDFIYKKLVRLKLIAPCFLVNPPVDVEPLAKRTEKDPHRVERFQVVAAGTELGKGFSELNDPLDQRARFEEQMKLRAAGDKEAQMLDEDFLEALEYGMPPAAGFGMSERLFAVLADKPVREAVFFPLMKDEK